MKIVLLAQKVQYWSITLGWSLPVTCPDDMLDTFYKINLLISASPNTVQAPHCNNDRNILYLWSLFAVMCSFFVYFSYGEHFSLPFYNAN